MQQENHRLSAEVALQTIARKEKEEEIIARGPVCQAERQHINREQFSRIIDRANHQAGKDTHGTVDL